MKTFKLFTILILIVDLFGSIAKADFVFGEPKPVGPPVNCGNTEYSASMSVDGLEIYFDAWEGGQTDIFAAQRNSTDDDWGEAVPLGSEVNSSAFEWTPRISADGLELYFASSRIGSLYSGFQIYVSRRQSKAAPWEPAENLGPMINSSYEQTMGSLSADGLELYYGTGGSYKTGNELRVATRPTKESDWTETRVIASTIRGIYPSISPGGLHLIFSSDSLSGGMGGQDLWMMTRASIIDEWSAPVNLGSPINSAGVQHRPWISHDGSTLLFTSGAIGGNIRQAPILPVVDLNGDGIVDALDMCMIVDHWGENYPLCDIGPTPMGDGFVDIQDLTVLAEHLFEEIPAP